MIQRAVLVALTISFIASHADAQNRRYRRRGALLGGIAGAAIGAAIGNKGNNETTGALIGGAVGAVAGGAIGDGRDRRIEHYNRYHRPYVYSQPVPHVQQPIPINQPIQPVHPYNRYPQTIHNQTPPPPPAPIVSQRPGSPSRHPVGISDVIDMHNRGMSDSIMIRQFELHGVAQELRVNDVLYLHKQGVSEAVISAMQDQYAVDVATQAIDHISPQRRDATTDIQFGPTLVSPVEGTAGRP